MRSYWLSMTVVAGLLLGYTAIVLNSHQTANTPKAMNEQEPREPATAQVAQPAPDSIN